MLMLNKPKCEKSGITTITTSPESYIFWEKHFDKNPLYFRIYADFEDDNEIDNSSIGNKTTKIYKQNPIPNAYHKHFDLEDVSKSGCFKSPLGYHNVDWFVIELKEIKK